MLSMTSPNKPLDSEKGAPAAGALFSCQDLVMAEEGFMAESIVDGPGLRCVLFVQGCPHACPGCHNPATHAFSKDNPVTVPQMLERIHQSPLCRGVTFSGGEPFCQAGALGQLAAQLRGEGYELAAYSGYTFEQLLQGQEDQRFFLSQLDILIDGPFLQGQKNLSLRFRGSANQRILNVPQSLAAGAAVWETHPRWVGDTK